MKTYDITSVINRINERVEAHRTDVGSYARWLWQNEKGNRELGPNPYGCADAANILYSIGRFPRESEERAAWVRTLQEMQSEDGQFHERTHHPIHTTAHCAAALELFDAAPAHPCTALLPYLEHENFVALMEGLDWTNRAWSESHKGAGVYVALNLCGAATRAWNDAYFAWFWENTDPETGMWMRPLSKEIPLEAPSYYYMAGSFHYLFNHEYAHMPLRYPERMIDFCLDLYDDREHLLPASFGTNANFIEVDWIFCLTRAQRQTPHRFAEVRRQLEDFAERYLLFWQNVDWEHEESVNDLHTLFGGVCALAELQQTLKGKLLSDTPLRLVLDRRPFI